MSETIYTIPINEAFEAAALEGVTECPFCKLRARLENNELDLILGASMMEPDVRIKTNEQGFCRRHFNAMLKRGNRLPMALTLESLLNEVCGEVEKKSVIGSPADRFLKRIDALNASCYVCGRADANFTHLIENAVYMYTSDGEFRDKFARQKLICLPHYADLLRRAKDVMSKKEFASFYEDTFPVVRDYFDSLCADVSWFCKKFDYRYQDEPWGNSKDSVERATNFLTGEEIV